MASFGEDVSWQKNRKRIAAVILAVVAFITAVAVVYSVLLPPEKQFYSKEISPGQAYAAWDGKSQPFGYVFQQIGFDMYDANGSIIYGSGTTATSWTCPGYVYGHEGNANYTVDHAVAWTDGTRSP
jgi:hypothetical protein